jgi:hypothetical protein
VELSAHNPPEEFSPWTANTGINSDSAGNYQLIEVESSVRMGFPPGITSSGTRNPPKECDSTGNNQLIQTGKIKMADAIKEQR